MASTDARPIPRKNTAYRVYFPILDADGDLVTGATGLDSEVSIDGAAFADCTNEATEIGSTGMYYLDLTSGEMNGDAITIIVKTTSSGAKTTPIVMYPEELGDVRVDPQTVWDALTAALTTANSIGKLLTDNVNATISSRASQTSLDTVDDFLDTEIAAILAAVDTEVAAIKAKTDNLPSDPADQSILEGKIDIIDDFLDTEIAAIKAKTDNLPAAPAAVSDIPTAAQNADAVWDEAASGHVASGSFGQALNIVRAGTAQAGAATTITLDASASAVDDFYNNGIIFITGGTGAGQSRIISDYNGTTKVATVPTWATNPSSDSVFVILPFGAIPGATAPTAAEVADAVWDEANADHVAAGSTGKALSDINTNAAAIKAKTDNLPSDPADASVVAGLIAAVEAKVDIIDDFLDTEIAAILAAVDTEVAAIKAKTDNLPTDPADQSILEGKIDIIDDFLDTEIAAIKAKTDSLTFTVANQVDARVVAGQIVVKKNTALAAFMFVMTDSTTHVPTTGLTVTAQRSIDGAAFGACANAVAEVASGVYKIDLAAADLNGNVIMLRFTAASADDQLLTVLTQP